MAAIVIALPGSDAHAAQLASRLGAPQLPAEVRRFPDGEIYVRLDGEQRPAIAGAEVILVGSLTGAGDRFLEVAFLAGAARDLGARRVGLVAPDLAYLRQDACFHPGEGVTATYYGRLLSSTVDWLVTVDPHLHRLDALAQVYAIPTTIAHAAAAIGAYVTAHVPAPLLVGPDAESLQWVGAVAAACGAPHLILAKTRRGDRDVSVALPADAGAAWAGRTPVLVDDIVSTGRTLIEATRALRAAGAPAPLCIAIHAVFADAALADLRAAGATGLVTCDTLAHPTNAITLGDAIAGAVQTQLG